MITVITKMERKYFHLLFKDPDTSYKVPIKLVSKLLSNITCEDCNNQILVKTQEPFEYFYMIKKGKVSIFDSKYNYMYDLDEGSYFGEYNILFGLYSNINVKARRS